MLNSVDAKVTLHDLHQRVTQLWDARFVDDTTSKAQLQHDMDAAEHSGLVSIDRLGTCMQYFKLTPPAGRDRRLFRGDDVGGFPDRHGTLAVLGGATVGSSQIASQPSLLVRWPIGGVRYANSLM